MRSLAPLAVLLALAADPAAQAAVQPQPGLGDPRIQVVPFRAEEVTELHATFGYAMTVQFQPGERLESIAIGDSRAWQVTPTRRGDLVVIKPIKRRGPTNMTVITTLRRYDFSLRVDAASEHPPVFGVRFDYPPPPFSEAVVLKPSVPEPPPAPEPPRASNSRYSFEGAHDLVPAKVFDDGLFTYFAFPEDADYPAIYALDPKGKEAIMNFSVRQGYIVVDRVSRGFVLRRGALIAKVTNDGFVGPQPTADSPRLRSRKGWN